MVDHQIADANPVVLQASGVSRSFRGLKALSGYSVTLRKGEILGVIGPNGAGKTTLFNVITGFVPPTDGQIDLNGASIVGKPPDAILRAGIARTFQNIRLFSGMTVLENVMTAQQVRQPMGLVQTLLSLPGFLGNERRMRDARSATCERSAWLASPISPRPHCPMGMQRKLEIARAIATSPTILLLDEPAAGMNEQETAEMTGFIREIRGKFELTIIVVEHDMSLIMRLCDRIQVLNYGSRHCRRQPGRDPQQSGCDRGIPRRAEDEPAPLGEVG